MTGHRKSYRKANHDYASPGFYFITILVKDRAPVFGKLFLDRVELSKYGEIALSCLQSLEESFPSIKLDEYIIMPDHIHAIIQIQESHSRTRHHRKDLINQVLTMMSDSSVVDVSTIESDSSVVDISTMMSDSSVVDVRTTMSDQTTSAIHTSSQDLHNRRDLINQVPTVTEPISEKDSWILMIKPEMHLGKVIRHYKAKTSFLIHKEGLKQFGWVSRYYDHIIRTEKSLFYIRKYIQENPIRHQYDKAA